MNWTLPIHVQTNRVILTVVLKLKDFWRSQAITCTVSVVIP